MKKIGLYALVLLPLVLLYAFFFGLKMNQETLASDGFIPEGTDETYLLQGSRTLESGSASVSFDLKTTEDHLTLMGFSLPPFSLCVNGDAIYEYRADSRSQVIMAIDLDTSPGEQIDLTMRGDEKLMGSNFFITSRDNAEKILETSNAMRISELGMMFAFAIYGFTLYLSKRSERYLLWFSAYTALLLLSAMLIYNYSYYAISTSSFFAFRNFLVVASSLLTIKLCFHFMEIELPRVLKFLVRPSVVMALSILAAMMSILFDSRFDFYIKLPFTLLTLAAAAYLCAHANWKNFWIAGIFLMSMAFRANGTVFQSLGFAESSFYSFYLTSPAADLPCVILYMICTNILFARKFIEAENLTVSLNEQVEERTAELREEQAQRHQLISNVSHDLRSPLFVIKGCSEMIESDEGDPKELAGIIKERAEYLTALTNDLFFIVKMECDKVIFENDIVDIGAEVDKCAAQASIAGQSKGLTVRSSTLPNCFVEGDSTRLSQALQNIVSNAIQYTKDNSRVDIFMARSLESTPGRQSPVEYVRISVRDQGPGLSPEEQENVFKMYYRAIRTSKPGSTGLGLSICDGIVKHHGGTVTVDSKIGEGSTFTISLPLAQSVPIDDEGGVEAARRCEAPRPLAQTSRPSETSPAKEQL